LVTRLKLHGKFPSQVVANEYNGACAPRARNLAHQRLCQWYWQAIGGLPNPKIFLLQV